MKFKYSVSVAALLIALCVPSFAGPFGLERGMTKDQVIALLGKDTVVSDEPDVRPYPSHRQTP